MDFVFKKHQQVLWRILFLLFCLMNFSPLVFAENPQDIFKQYEEVMTMAEEHNLYEEDAYQILPKIRRTGELILNKNFGEAETLLKDIKTQFLILDTAKPATSRRNLKMQWMEMFFGMFQECLMLVLLALGFSKWSLFRPMLLEGHLRLRGKIMLTLLFGVLAILFSIYDLSRYGQSAWTSFDIQIPFIVAGGILGGAGVSLILGILLAFFRYSLEPEMLMFPMIVLGVAGIVAFFSLRIRSFENLGKISFLVGFIAGLFHSLMVFVPLNHLMTPGYLVFCILFIAFLEGLGGALFPAVTSAVIRESKRVATEKELLKTRLLFLQAQISPHFFFNALNTIGSLCRKAGAKDAQNVVLRLSEFFRRILKRHDDLVSLREELDYIEAYVEVERANRGGILNYEKEILLSDESLNQKLPLLILQPVIENAVKYGLGKEKRDSKLKLTIREDSKDVDIQFEDNGPGILAADIPKILKGEIVSQSSTGIGIKNIHERLLYYYGKDHGLHIESDLGKGTIVKIKIPKGK